MYRRDDHLLQLAALFPGYSQAQALDPVEEGEVLRQARFHRRIRRPDIKPYDPDYNEANDRVQPMDHYHYDNLGDRLEKFTSLIIYKFINASLVSGGNANLPRREKAIGCRAGSTNSSVWNGLERLGKCRSFSYLSHSKN